MQAKAVVNCFKMCIFAVASTIVAVGAMLPPTVVNCFKMCIFAVASTIENKYCSDSQLVTLFLCKIKTAI